jgi:hypothetical protein
LQTTTNLDERKGQRNMPVGGVHPIVVGETSYQFTSRALCLHFWDAFATHFSLHQFEVATKGGL